MSNSRHYKGVNRTLLWWAFVGLFGLGILTSVQAQPIPDCKPVCLPITVRRISPGSAELPPVIVVPLEPPVVVEPPKPESLEAPIFSEPAGLIGFGDKITLSVSNAPADVTIEFSTDGGTTWTAGSEMVIDGKKTVLTRSRQQDRVSETVTASYAPYYRRMLVIGNSIMSHGPAPDLGWLNFNGMAASAPEKDFVHLLTASLATLNAQITVRLQSGGNFERFFGQPDYSLNEFDEALQAFTPDLIILRIGENVDEGAVVSRNLEGQLRQLIDKLTTYRQPVRLVTTTSVWNQPQTDAVIRKVISEKGYPLVDLSGMVDKGQYFASQYANPGVARHPNDAGMQYIADLIWDAIR